MPAIQPAAIDITGKTRIYGFLGDPVEYARTPQNVNPKFMNIGKNAILVPLHIRSGNFENTIEHLLKLENMDGIVVTMPFKERIIPFVNSLSNNAEAVKAVNAAKRMPDGSWHGDIFDGAGLVGAAHAARIGISGLNVGLIGAGGAGSAIAYSLIDGGIKSLSVIDANHTKTENLIAGLKKRTPAPVSAGHIDFDNLDLLINATPVGMNPSDTTAIDITKLTGKTAVIDIVTKPGTMLSRRAAELGCKFTDGAAMVAAQAEAIFSFFVG